MQDVCRLEQGWRLERRKMFGKRMFSCCSENKTGCFPFSRAIQFALLEISRPSGDGFLPAR